MAERKNFSIKEAIRYGWETTKKHFWFLLIVLVITNGVSWLVSYISSSMQTGDGSSGMITLLLTVIGWILGLELSFATIAVLFKLTDKKKAGIEDLFSFFHAETLFKYFLVTLLYGLLVAFGLILFIIPGIYWGVKYGFATFIFVDKRTGVMEAFRKSAQMADGLKWKLFQFGLVMLLLIVAGALAFGIGLLIAIPVVYLAEVYVYRKLATHVYKS